MAENSNETRAVPSQDDPSLMTQLRRRAMTIALQLEELEEGPAHSKRTAMVAALRAELTDTAAEIDALRKREAAAREAAAQLAADQADADRLAAEAAAAEEAARKAAEKAAQEQAASEAAERAEAERVAAEQQAEKAAAPKAKTPAQMAAGK